MRPSPQTVPPFPPGRPAPTRGWAAAAVQRVQRSTGPGRRLHVPPYDLKLSKVPPAWRDTRLTDPAGSNRWAGRVLWPRRDPPTGIEPVKGQADGSGDVRGFVGSWEERILSLTPRAGRAAPTLCLRHGGGPHKVAPTQAGTHTRLGLSNPLLTAYASVPKARAGLGTRVLYYPPQYWSKPSRRRGRTHAPSPARPPPSPGAVLPTRGGQA